MLRRWHLGIQDALLPAKVNSYPYLCLVLSHKVLHPLDEIRYIARMAIALGDIRG